MATAKNTRGGDLTARQIAAANKKRDAEQANRAAEMSMATAAAEKALKEEVVDLTGSQPVVEVDPKEASSAPAKGAPKGAADGAGEDVQVVEVEVAEKVVEVRVNEDIEMNFGGTQYKLDVGPRYKLPKHIADWLEEKGILWH